MSEQTQIAVPGRTRRAAATTRPRPASLSAGHSGSTRSSEPEPGGGELADLVAEGAVVLDVDRGSPASSNSTYGAAVEVRPVGRQPGRARVVGERPAHRVGDREHPPPAGPQHPGDLAHTRRRVGDERDGAERRARQVERGGRERQRARRRPARAARAAPVRRAEPARLGEHARADRSSATGSRALRQQPARRTARRRRRPRAPAARRSGAEQPGVLLAQALRAPDEVGVAEERAVLGLVRRRPSASHQRRLARAATRLRREPRRRADARFDPLAICHRDGSRDAARLRTSCASSAGQVG